jgi:uncharacterized SAM-binding protein YcdF (DUF218 family)
MNGLLQTTIRLPVDRISASLFLDPIFALLVLLAIALLLAGRRRRAVIGPRRARRGLWLAWLVWATMWLFATPRFSFGVLGMMEMPPADVAAALGDTPEDRCAMIVLSGGNRSPRPGTWRSERLVASSLPRAIGAARVYHERPVGHVIVTGRGAPLGQPDETAGAMADVMVAHGVPRERIVLEPMALNTRQNAEFSAGIVRGLGVEKTLVVTSALHMRRAVLELERAGLRVIAAPVDHRHDPLEGLAPFVPSTGSLVIMYQVLHEIFGRFKP